MARKRIGLITLTAFCLVAGCAHEKGVEMTTGLLQEARQKLVPDKRTQVFDVKGELNGNTLTLKGDVHNAQLKEQLLAFVQEKGSYVVVDSVRVLPQASLNGKTYGIVSVSVANIRTAPDHGAEMATQAILGTPLTVLKKQSGWYLVQTPDKYLGWTDDNVAMMNHEEYVRWVSLPKVIVTTEYGFTRLTEDQSSRPVSDIVIGAIFALKSEGAERYQVQYPDGRVGFLMKSEATPLGPWLAAAQDTPEKILATAHRFFGVPYLWGGTSSKALDCSGFVKTVYFLNGVLLPRDASQQALVGEPVPLSPGFEALKPGDLLFFGGKATANRPERVTHVGISLGGARFIHESGDVRLNSLNPKDADYSPSRHQALLRATRIIGVGEDRGIYRLDHIPYYHGNEQ